MNTDAPFVPPRKKHNVLWWLGGFFVLVVLLFLAQLFGPNPRIIVSPQTTYITKPLGPDGLPDYEQFLLEWSREGATPENNAAALLWQALFPGDVDPQHHAAMAAELGLEQVPSKDDALVPLHSNANRNLIVALLKERAEAESDELSPNERQAISSADWFDANSGTSDEVLGQLMERPWTSAELPPLANWARENKEPLDLIVEASRRPRYYMPSPTLINGKRDLLIEMLLPHVQSIREAGRALPARAMWHLGEGRSDDAWQDLLALHRIARLTTQGHTLIEHLVAIAMSGNACNGTLTLVHQGSLSAEQARQVLRELNSLPSFSSVAQCLDGGERAWALDAFVRVGSGGGGELFGVLTGDPNETGSTAFNIVSVDWNLVLREANRWYDRLAAAAKMPDRKARSAAMAKVDADIQQFQSEVHTPAQMLAGVVSRKQRSRLVSGIMLSLFLPALSAVTDAEDRANTVLDLTRLAAMLAVYRAEHGEYPEKIEDLVPGVIEKLPLDLYNGKPFIYKRQEEGFLLYSPGDNGTDDGGSNVMLRVLNGQPLDELDEGQQQSLEPTIPGGADDISVRAQRRVFEWPKLTPPE